MAGAGARRRHLRPGRHGTRPAPGARLGGVPEDLDGALLRLRPLLLDPDRLVRAVAAGKRRSAAPPWRRAELRPIDLKDGRHLQVVTYDERKATHARTRVRRAGRGRGRRAAGPAVRQLARADHDRDAAAAGHQEGHGAAAPQGRSRTRSAPSTTGPRTHLIDPGDPLFSVLGAGAGKRRQVDAFLRVLQAAVAEARPAGRPTAAGRRPRLRQRVPHLRGLPVPRRAATTCASPESTSDRRCASATPRWPPSSAGPSR